MVKLVFWGGGTRGVEVRGEERQDGVFGEQEGPERLLDLGSVAGDGCLRPCAGEPLRGLFLPVRRPCTNRDSVLAGRFRSELDGTPPVQARRPREAGEKGDSFAPAMVSLESLPDRPQRRLSCLQLTLFLPRPSVSRPCEKPNPGERGGSGGLFQARG